LETDQFSLVKERDTDKPVDEFLETNETEEPMERDSDFVDQLKSRNGCQRRAAATAAAKA
jgi:hypothetical protein